MPQNRMKAHSDTQNQKKILECSANWRAGKFHAPAIGTKYIFMLLAGLVLPAYDF